MTSRKIKNILFIYLLGFSLSYYEAKRVFLTTVHRFSEKEKMIAIGISISSWAGLAISIMCDFKLNIVNKYVLKNKVKNGSNRSSYIVLYWSDSEKTWLK